MTLEQTVEALHLLTEELESDVSRAATRSDHVRISSQATRLRSLTAQLSSLTASEPLVPQD